MVRALAVFAAAAALVVGTGWFCRAVLHLDCLGPYIDGWGCLTAPYPAALPGDSTAVFDLGVAVAGFVVCLIVKDAVWSLAARAVAVMFPTWARRTASAPSRSYPVR